MYRGRDKIEERAEGEEIGLEDEAIEIEKGYDRIKLKFFCKQF